MFELLFNPNFYIVISILFPASLLAEIPAGLGLIWSVIITGISMSLDVWTEHSETAAFLSQLAWILSFRPVFFQIRRFLFWVGRQTTYTRVFGFLGLLTDAVGLIFWFQFLFFILTGVVSFVLLVKLASTTVALLFIFFLTPFYVAILGMVFYQLSMVLMWVFFGYPMNTIDLHRVSILFITLIRTFVKGLWDAFAFTLISPLHIFTAMAMTTKAAFLLPVELVTMIIGDGQEVGASYQKRYFWIRFFFGLDIMVTHLLGLKILFMLTLAFAFGSMAVGLLFTYAMMGSTAFPAVFLGLFEVLGSLIGSSVSNLSSFYHNDFKVSILTLVFWVRSLWTPYVIIVPDRAGVPRRFSKLTDFREIAPYLVDRVFRRTIFTQFGGLTPLFLFACILIVVARIYRMGINVGRKVLLAPAVFLETLVLGLIPFFIPDLWIELSLSSLALLWGLILDPQFDLKGKFLRTMRLLGVTTAFGITWLSGPLQDQLAGGGLKDDFTLRLSQVFVMSWVSLTRRSILKFVEALDHVRLPEMIQAAYNPPSLDSIRSTYVTLQGMGFPVDQSFIKSLDRPESSAYLAEWGSWKNHLIGTSNFALGFRSVSVALHSWLPDRFFPEVPGYIHSTQFTGVAEEINSTARYWTNNVLDALPDGSSIDELVEDMWVGVQAQYGGSRLSTFNDVYNKWVKRFNMGIGFGKQNHGKLKQLTRQAVIDAMGGKKPFLKAWERVFYNAQKLLMPSPVFTKWESLKLKKALSRSVRTVVGSAFVHHVMTTVFNYKPNHNYHPWETPSKVGMPINGQNYNRLWESLMRHEKIWAGDMTAFDSTQAPVILKVVAGIRKKGYTLHRDYDKICQLIDISYEMLRDQPLAFKNFGDIADKAQGFTTGHSSTTPDNSMALVINYLYAWRRVTGLRAREFFNFNTLANFGDDHVLGYDAVFGWTPQKAIQAMAELGTVMRDEAPGQESLPIVGRLPPGKKDWREQDFAFLSKMPLPLDSVIRSELSAAGVTVPLTFATCHDKRRLLGKIKGQLTKSKSKNLESSYDALLSYMYLCAHHKDVYDELTKNASPMYLEVKNLVQRRGGKVSSIQRPPSYNQVLRQWYSSEPFPYKNDDLEGVDEDLDRVFVYSSPDAFGTFIRWVSDFPTLLSPRYKNVRWADWVQEKLSDRLAWPLVFIGEANGVSNDLMTSKLLLSRTPYSYLRSDAIINNDPNMHFGTYLFRHWCYMGLTRVFTYRKAFSPLDLVRLLDSFWINLILILTGRVSQIVVELDLHILDTLIVWALSYVFVPLPIPPIWFDLGSPSLLVGRFVSWLFTILSPAGSIDFQPFDEQVRHLLVNPDASFALQAPTGVGKSTRLINRLQEMSALPVTVIVPRRTVAVGVGEYMRSLYPNSGIGIQVEGFTSKPDDRIIYTTAQSFFTNPHLRDPRRILVLDEAHIDEPHYHVLREFFKNRLLKRVLITATPLKDFGLPLLVLPSASSFRVVDRVVEDHTFDKYVQAAAAFANDRTSFEKILIFVPTLALMDKLASLMRHKVCRLSSKHRELDNSAVVYISTNVADAGLTIPDVSFVISPDVDLAVTESMDTSKYDIIKKPYYYKLSPETIIQRKGRTGRTLDGVFMLFKIIDIESSDKTYNVMDYISSLAPASALCWPYLPEHVKKSVPYGFEAALPSYDLNPRSYGSIVTRLENPANFTRYGSIERFYELYTKNVKESGIGKRAPNPDFEALPVESWPYSHVPEDAVPIAPPPPRHPSPEPPVIADSEATPKPLHVQLAPVEEPVEQGWVPRSEPPAFERKTFKKWDFSEVNVSGAGLLCGVRALRGLIYTHQGVLLSEQLVLQLIKDSQHGPEDLYQEDFFAWDLIRDLADQFQIRLTLHHINPDGSKSIIKHPFDLASLPLDGFKRGVLILSGAHYTYVGVQCPEGGFDDNLNMIFKPLKPSQYPEGQQPQYVWKSGFRGPKHILNKSYLAPP